MNVKVRHAPQDGKALTREEAVILENASLILRPESLCNVLAFFWSEDNAAEILVHGKIVMEETAILRHDVDGLPEDRPRLSVQRMTMGSRLYFGPSLRV